MRLCFGGSVLRGLICAGMEFGSVSLPTELEVKVASSSSSCEKIWAAEFEGDIGCAFTEADVVIASILATAYAKLRPSNEAGFQKAQAGM